jgi:ABC-type branched-subunit amino acid transport system substrate-binding protein
MRKYLRRAATAALGSTIVCATLLTTVAGATPSGASQKYPPIPPGPITFGVSTPLSGAEASYGIFTKLGFNVAMDYFNQEHPNGINGHQVKLTLLDDGSNVTQAVQTAQQLVADKVAAVVTLTTDPAAATQQFAVMQKNKVPVVANLSLPTGSIKQLSTEYPYLFSPNPAAVQYIVDAGKWVDSKGYKKVAFLSDGIPADTQVENEVIQGIGEGKPKATVVDRETIAPGSVDDSAAVTKLKASGADLLIVTAGEAYGPIWQSILASGWSPTILASAGAWYSGFTSMGSLTPNAYAFYYECADSSSQTFSAVQNQLMSQYATATSSLVTNYLTFLATDSEPLEILYYAITKYNSVAPAALKAAIEGIHNKSFLGLTYNFSSTNHFGLTGSFGPAVCHMGAPYAGGVGKVPVKG